MKTTAEERANLRSFYQFKSDGVAHSICRLLDDIDELLAERRTLRDDMAMAALTGYLSDTKHPDNATPSVVAGWCYANADAMLAARRHTTEGGA